MIFIFNDNRKITIRGHNVKYYDIHKTPVLTSSLYKSNLESRVTRYAQPD